MHLMFSLLCLLVFGAGTYLYSFGFKQKSTVVKIGGAVVSFGAIALIVFTLFFRPVGRDWDRHHMGEEGKPPMCPMMEMQKPMMNMGGCGCGCGCSMGAPNVDIQRPAITPDKYHQPMKHLMTDPMEAKPKK